MKKLASIGLFVLVGGVAAPFVWQTALASSPVSPGEAYPLPSGAVQQSAGKSAPQQAGSGGDLPFAVRRELADRVSQLEDQISRVQQSEWTGLNLASGWRHWNRTGAFAPSWMRTGDLLYFSGAVEPRNLEDVRGPTRWFSVATLPADARPESQVNLQAALLSPTGSHRALNFVVDPAGTVRVHVPTGQEFEALSLDGLSIRLQ